MNVKTEDVEGKVVVTVLETRFTNMIAGDFRDKVESLIESGSVNLLVNLERVTYMDSAGLGGIISVYNTIQEYNKNYDTNGKLVVFGLNSTVGMLFSMLHVDEVMQIAKDRQTALALFD